MPKVKISEYSATANSNTDVASINIDEGCAPSGINNAIRAIMGHLKDFQQGTNGDPFNGPVNGTVGATTPSTGAFTTLSSTGNSYFATSSGSVGIGTSSPASKIQAYAGTGVGASHATFGASATGYWNFNSSGASSDRVIARGYNSTGTEVIRLDPAGDSFINGGNLGLGVTPSAWASIKALQVVNASFGGLGGGNYSAANAYYDGTNWKYITSNYATLYQQSGNAGDGVHKWNIAASGTAGNAISFTQAMTLDASGNLGVGATSPAKKLDVYLGTTGTVGQYLRNTTINLLSQIDGTSSAQFGTETSHPLVFLTANTERARIDSSGNFRVGVGTSTINTYMDVNHATGSGNGASFFVARYNGTQIGDISQATTSTVAYNTSSDYRLKENIQPMTGALAKVALLKPCIYTWKVDGAAGQGFIAHELQEVVPDCVTGEKDAIETYIDDEGNEQTRPKYQGIDTSFLVATLTAAIQEQQAIIQSLTARITALEGA